MSVLVKLREYHTLSNSENEVRMYILRNSKRVISMSTQELAAKSYTSPATVIRLCKRLELKGYSELKIQLASEIKAFETMNLDVVDQTTFKKGDSLTELIDKVTDISIHSIEETRLLLDYEVLLCVAGQIMDASIIDLYGVGASNNIAFDAGYKFMRIGKSISCLSLIDRQRIQAINSDSSHFAIIISYSGETPEIIEIAKILEKNNVPAVSITGSIQNQLVNLVEYNLFVSSRESNFRNGAIVSRTSTLYMLDLIYITCISLNYDDSAKRLGQTLTISK